MPPAELIQVDGSGLSRYNYVTPEALVTILTHVDRDERLREPFEAALPIAGRDGTLAGRMKGNRRGRQRAREDRIDVQRARGVGLRAHGRRRAAGLLDHREQLRRAAGRHQSGDGCHHRPACRVFQTLMRRFTTEHAESTPRRQFLALFL